MLVAVRMFVFFKLKTAYEMRISDCSSDVCSSDLSYGYRADGAAAVQNKVGAFLADPVMRRIVTAPEREISIRRTMDEGKVLLVNLGKGRLGDDSARLLGGLLVTTVGLAGFSRADTPPEERRPLDRKSTRLNSSH